MGGAMSTLAGLLPSPLAFRMTWTASRAESIRRCRCRCSTWFSLRLVSATGCQPKSRRTSKLAARVAKRTPPGEINLNCEEFKGGSMSLRCFLKGTQVDNEGKWVDIELDDLGKKELKGVREKRRVFAVRMKEDERMSAEESLESLESISSL